MHPRQHRNQTFRQSSLGLPDVCVNVSSPFGERLLHILVRARNAKVRNIFRVLVSAHQLLYLVIRGFPSESLINEGGQTSIQWRAKFLLALKKFLTLCEQLVKTRCCGGWSSILAPVKDCTCKDKLYLFVNKSFTYLTNRPT